MSGIQSLGERRHAAAYSWLLPGAFAANTAD